MKKLSLKLLSDIVVSHRKSKNITQTELSKLTGINRTLLSPYFILSTTEDSFSLFKASRLSSGDNTSKLTSPKVNLSPFFSFL